MKVHRRIVLWIVFVMAADLAGCSKEPVATAPATQTQSVRVAVAAKPLKVPPCPAGAAATPPLQASNSHQVVLSWQASVPTPNAANDPVAGYCVYRSTKKKAGLPDKIRVSANPLAGTGCIDDTPQDGQTYFYSLLAISSKSRTSIFSGEVRAAIPSTKRSTPLPTSYLPLCRGEANNTP